MSQLEDYFEKQSYLPQEVRRNLDLIRKLDEEVLSSQQKIEDLQKQYFSLQRQKKPKDDLVKLKEEIDYLYEEGIKTSSEKISIADKTYQLIDNSVRELDDGLKKFEDSLKASINPDQSKLRKSQVQLSKYQRDRRKKIHQEIEQSKEIFQTNAALNEPIYCTCQKPSFGQMIMCDNNLCEKEWFHLECIKLKDFPTENQLWFCSQECKKEQKQSKQQSQTK